MSEPGTAGPISLSTMRAWKSGLEQLGAAGDLDLLRLVVEERQHREAGEQSNHLTPEQIGMIEGLTGVKAEYDTSAGMGASR
jgi:hypothetical protein